MNYLRRPRSFYGRLFRLALPLILQNLITTSLGFVDTFMVGLLGQEELSAVTAANSPIFLVQVIVFGLISGLTVLISQYWGKGDIDAVNRAMGVAFYFGVTIAALFALALFFFPKGVMGLVTNNERLIVLGAPYVRIVGISYIFNAASSVYVGMQRSTENPAMGLTVFAISMCLNTCLNYIFIFGKFGAPALGVTGAAVATLASRIVEFLITAGYAIRCRRVPLRPKSMFRPGTEMVRSFIKYSSPVLLNESLWGLGTTVMVSALGHMAVSTDILAAHAIMGNVDKFATVACFGIAGASAVIVGKSIGEGASQDEVYSLSWCLLLVSVLIGACVSLGLAIALPVFFIPYLFPLFQLQSLAMDIAVKMCLVHIVMMPLRAFDITNITGILRAGGDARMAAVIDILPLWLIAVPMTALTGLVLNAPVLFVCISLQAETFCKPFWGTWRLRSRKWINDITQKN